MVSTLWEEGGESRIQQREKVSSVAIPTKSSADHMASSEAGMDPFRCPQLRQEGWAFIYLWMSHCP